MNTLTAVSIRTRLKWIPGLSTQSEGSRFPAVCPCAAGQKSCVTVSNP